VDDPGMTDRTATDVTVLGLGAMGSALARALVGAGHRTVVWNRTASRAEPLVALGAEAAPDPAAAVAGADVVIVSLVDGEAATAVLTAAGPALAGTTVVELPPSRPGRPRPSASSSRAPAPPTSRAR
jgi:3-hydroxyisobutyrate dehydrogenase-like beta-hydroxyacid dehydrogenase